MAQSTTINVRVDEDVKREAEAMLDKLGMNISVLVNMTLRQVIMDKALPFLPKYKPDDAGYRLRETFRNSHAQAILNGTSEMTMDEINEIIAERRAKERTVK